MLYAEKPDSLKPPVTAQQTYLFVHVAVRWQSECTEFTKVPPPTHPQTPYQLRISQRMPVLARVAHNGEDRASAAGGTNFEIPNYWFRFCKLPAGQTSPF